MQLNTHVTAWAQTATWLTFLSISPSLDFIGVGADVDAGVDVGADADVGAGVGAVGTGADAVVVGVGFGAGVSPPPPLGSSVVCLYSNSKHRHPP